jgi:hypothetical protein
MTLTTVDDVARAKPPAGPDPEVPARKPMVVQIRGSEGYKAWVESVARKDGLTLAALFDRAVRKYAKEIGFTEDPPPR